MARVQITIKLNEEVVEALKKRAEKGEGKGRYQTLINEILADWALSDKRKPKTVPLEELEKLVEKWR